MKIAWPCDKQIERLWRQPQREALCCSTCTAILKKVVGKSAETIPKGIVGGFEVHCSSKKFGLMAREAMDICLWVLKESNKCRFDSYSVRGSVLIISHIILFRDCRVHIFLLEIALYICLSASRDTDCTDLWPKFMKETFCQKSHFLNSISEKYATHVKNFKSIRVILYFVF